MSISFVIPSYGLDHSTEHVVTMLLDDGVDASNVIVVDNMGSFESSAPIRMIHPTFNLGWLVATNLGMELAFRDETCRGVVWLNNDVDLSSGFAAALERQLDDGAWMVAPLYDGPNRAQQDDAMPDLASFVAGTGVRPVEWAEGTCVLVSRHCFETVGLLDATWFGWRGWGADIDYALRAGRHGGNVVVTEAAYLHHVGGGTTKATAGDTHEYNSRARLEMALGLRRHWGANWAVRYDVPGRRTTSRRGRARLVAMQWAGLPKRRVVIRRRVREAERLLHDADPVRSPRPEVGT